MTQHEVTTPFGRRAVTLGQMAARLRAAEDYAAAVEPGSNRPAAVNKWALFRALTAIRETLYLSDRTLSVLNALLSFHPETALTLPAAEDGAGDGAGIDLVVFPSNRQLAARAHGMAEKTLRRHLAALVEAGLIFRRDSPNGKRYARRDEDGDVAQAFGFDLTPLVLRAPEFEMEAARLRQEAARRAALKERISLDRRDIGKLIALGLAEALPGDWEALRRRHVALLQPLRGLRAIEALGALAEALTGLRIEVGSLVERSLPAHVLTGNDGSGDRHQSTSKPDALLDLEPASEEAGGGVAVEERSRAPETKAAADLPLGLVLEACPDLLDHAGGPVRSWPQFVAAAATVRPMLGISPDAWREAVGTMGEAQAAVCVAAILQRSEYSSEARVGQGSGGRPLTAVNGSPAIRSPGGYLRSLREKAEAGTFAPGPILMALIGQRLKARTAPASLRLR